ncbi:hypothetical protein NHJ6243_009004 [Beauveria neobassiana]
MAAYNVEEEIAAFFKKTTASRANYEEKARSLTGSDRVLAIPIQGSSSYSMYAGASLEHVVQCRPRSLALKMDMYDLARNIHGPLVPAVQSHGELGGSDANEEAQNDGREPLVVYLMTRLPGVTELDFALSRNVSQDCPEFFPFRQNLFTDLASFFARSWLAPQSVSSEYRENLKAEYGRDLNRLLNDLPDQFKPHAEATVRPFGLDLHFLQRFAGAMHLSNGWSRFPDYDAVEETFWAAFTRQVGSLGDQTIRNIKRARVLGVLLSHGFTSRLANQPEPVVLKDDDHGRYQMMYLDGYLINPATRLDGTLHEAAPPTNSAASVRDDARFSRCSRRRTLTITVELETTTTMTQLTGLPAELLHQIFSWLDPRDLGALPRVCQVLNNHVKGNWKLCQDVYLNHLDKPQNNNNIDWEQALHDFVRLKLICDRPAASDKESELPFVHKTVTDLLDRASSRGYTNDNSNTHSASRNADFLRQLFGSSESTRAAFLERSFLFERVRCERPLAFPRSGNDDAGAAAAAAAETHQRSARLHCLYGAPILNVGRLRSTRTYPFACSTVYDMRGHTERTGWGPFRDDGSGKVDWEKVEAVMVVLGYNIQSKRFVSKLFSDVWNTPFSGSWSQSFMQTPALSPAHEPSSLELSDPYGVTGTWYRVVCFLDYNDFFNYNFPMGDPFPENLPRPGISVGEATRLIILKLHITRIEPPGPEDGQALPVVHFAGDSRLLDDGWDANGASELKGTVRLTKEGEVRWTSTSIYNGEERWKSEGIQVGGVRSARGVLGFWFDSEYDAHGPVGPTAIWKASDSEAPYGKIADILPTGFLAYSALVSVEDSDPEGEMDYTADEEDEEEEEMEIDVDLLRGELPALLLDANMEILTAPPAEDDMND